MCIRDEKFKKRRLNIMRMENSVKWRLFRFSLSVRLSLILAHSLLFPIDFRFHRNFRLAAGCRIVIINRLTKKIVANLPLILMNQPINHYWKNISITMSGSRTAILTVHSHPEAVIKSRNLNWTATAINYMEFLNISCTSNSYFLIKPP